MSRQPSKRWSRPDSVNVAHVVDRCRVLGPGERFVLWVQGCHKRCPGCHNPQFLEFKEAIWCGVEELVARILAVGGIEGVTFVGGEPFTQAMALSAVAMRAREAGLSVMVYSGYTIAELTSGKVPDAQLLLDAIDLLLDGPYLKDLPTQKPWRGSDNQQLIALSPRYAREVALWNQPLGQSFEMRVAADGTLEVLGIPPADLTVPLPSVGVRQHDRGTERQGDSGHA